MPVHSVTEPFRFLGQGHTTGPLTNQWYGGRGQVTVSKLSMRRYGVKGVEPLEDLYLMIGFNRRRRRGMPGKSQHYLSQMI